MVLYIAGTNLDPGKIERAIELSRNKYCSVYNSLRPDLALSVRFVLEDKNSVENDKKDN
jgi:uncharacterized OsmC-like protein